MNLIPSATQLIIFTALYLPLLCVQSAAGDDPPAKKELAVTKPTVQFPDIMRVPTTNSFILIVELEGTDEKAELKLRGKIMGDTMTDRCFS